VVTATRASSRDVVTLQCVVRLYGEATSIPGELRLGLISKAVWTISPALQVEVHLIAHAIKNHVARTILKNGGIVCVVVQMSRRSLS
jgi:hypothetical protein